MRSIASLALEKEIKTTMAKDIDSIACSYSQEILDFLAKKAGYNKLKWTVSREHDEDSDLCTLMLFLVEDATRWTCVRFRKNAGGCGTISICIPIGKYGEQNDASHILNMILEMSRDGVELVATNGMKTVLKPFSTLESILVEMDLKYGLK